jgi:hypothetical protein
MTGVPYGFSMTEKVQKDIEVDGKTWVGIKRLALKPFDTFLFLPDEYGNITKCIQRFEGYEQTIDMERFIHYVQNADVDQHYGQSELREAYRAWFSKDIAIRFWNIFLERYASGFLKIQPKDGVKVTAGSAEHTALVNLLTNIGPKTGVLLPSGVEAELVYPATTDAYEKAIASHDKAIAKALLVPNLMGISEQGQTGSYSQSQTQLEAFMWTLEAETNRLEEILNEHLFRPLGELNFGAGPYPRFCFKPLSEAMKMQIIKTWVELVKASAVTPTDADEDHIRELLDFPEAGEPLEISAPSAAGVALDPVTGKPLPPDQQPLDKANLPPTKKMPVGKGKQRPDETVIGAKRTGILVNGAHIEFYSEDQPRDDSGRWGSGGSANGEGGGATLSSSDGGSFSSSVDAAYADQGVKDWQADYVDSLPLKGYFGTSQAFEINNNLRSGKPVSGRAQDALRAVEKGFKESSIELAEGTTLHRAVSGEFAAQLSGMSPGDSFTDKGFFSTAGTIKATERFGTTRMEITTGRGARVLVFKDESEVLFPRGSKITVTGKQKTKKGTVIRVHIR